MTLDIEDVTFCDPAQESDNPEEVTFCDPAQEPADPEDVMFCDGTGQNTTSTSTDGTNCPDGTTVVSLSGSDAPSNGDTYTASGGILSYTFHCSGASLTITGPATAVINVDGACGTGSVTVTDGCGQTASIEVRYPSGQWVLVGSCGTDPGSFVRILGGAKYVFGFGCYPDGSCAPEPCPIPAWCLEGFPNADPLICTYCHHIIRPVDYYRKYTWGCP